MMNDPELQEIFTDPAHQEVVDLLKVSRPAAPPLDPHFRSYLRAKLMTEARRTLGPQASRSWFPFRFTPKTLGPAMAAVAAGFIVVLGVEVYLHNQGAPTSQVAVNLVNNKTDVPTADPIQLHFSGPVDKNAVEASVQIEPATSVTKQWDGNTLVIVPDHQLAPNTTYTVTLKPAATAPTPNPVKPAVTPQPTPAPTPVVVHFTTTPAPVSPAVTQSFKSSTVGWRHDDRLANSSTMLNATWTPAGQLLVTRPAGLPGPGATASSSPSASPVGNATTDVWLMNASGTPLRILAPSATLPSAAPTGGLFASWNLGANNQATLQIRDLQGTLISTVATVKGVPDRPAVWVGSDRVAYLDHGALNVFGLHTPVKLTETYKLDQGSLAGSPDGQLLAAQTTDRSMVIDLATGAPRTRLPTGATGFAWSSKGDLAFLLQHDAGSDLYLYIDGKYARVASSSNGQAWSDLNWAPDATSLLLATKPTAGAGSTSLLLINRDGSNPTAFGSPQTEYSSPQWAPAGDLVLFIRRDDATGARVFWTATAMPSASDGAEQLALAEVNTFMQARLHGDSNAALAELDDAGKAAYQTGTMSLVSAAGTRFNRYYPVSVQLTASAPNKFLVGVRIFIAKSGVETSFLEEQLTLLEQGQKYLIDGASATATMPVGHGPTVVSVQVAPGDSHEQVRVHFDADLASSTVSSDTIKIRDLKGNDLSGKVTFDPNNHLATVVADLQPGNTYQLVVTTGITDINGVAMAQEYDAPLVIANR